MEPQLCKDSTAGKAVAHNTAGGLLRRCRSHAFNVAVHLDVPFHPAASGIQESSVQSQLSQDRAP